MKEDDTEPVVDCCPCIKRLMIVIMVGTIVTGVLIVKSLEAEKAWDDVVQSKAAFPSTHKPKQSFFQDKFVLIRKRESEIEKVWLSLSPKYGFQRLAELAILSLFLLILLAHFTGFCCCRDFCFSSRGLRIATYTVYTVGAVMFISVAASLSSYHAQYRSNYLSARTKFEQISGNLSLPLGRLENGSEIKSVELSSSKLAEISRMCYQNQVWTLRDWADFRNVYPQYSPHLRLLKVQGEYYELDDLVTLGFCQSDMESILSIALSVAMGLVCLLLPVAGSIQMNRRRPKIHPIARHSNSLESVRSAFTPPNSETSQN